MLMRLVHLARDIKLSHSIFALPFALLATFLAAASTKPTLPDAAAFGLIVLCMVLARTVAMTVNRWADAAHDACNPRTQGRAIPSGRLSASFVLLSALTCAVGFVLAAAGFWWLDNNPWPLALSPFVLAWLAGYSFTKRFTWLCHLFLGSALALSPLAATIAIEPWYLSRPEPYLLALMVLCWVAGFDVIYALQDEQIDRETGLYSIPANLGVEPALWIARGLHLLSVLALLLLVRISPTLGTGFGLGLVFVAILLIVEHGLVWGSKTHHIHLAFFTLNGVISVVLGGLGIFDVVRSLP